MRWRNPARIPYSVFSVPYSVRTQHWEFRISLNAEAADAASELLSRHFQLPVTSYEDFDTHRCKLSVVLQSQKGFAKHRRAVLEGLNQIRDCGLVTGRTAVSIRAIKPKDWSESWKRHFRPIMIGKRLLIKASWHRRAAKKNQEVVVLDPGLSFGTGQHATTSFCLSEIVRLAPKDGGRVALLDIGTGSGILAIAAAKLGYSPVKAFDFDPQAIIVAKKNASENSVAKRIGIHRGDVTKLQLRDGQQYSVVCANLISNLLVEERYRILNSVAPSGVIVLAGILATEFKSVQRAYESAGCKLLRSRSEKEWRSASFRRPAVLRKARLSSRHLGTGLSRKHWAD